MLLDLSCEQNLFRFCENNSFSICLYLIFYSNNLNLLQIASEAIFRMISNDLKPKFAQFITKEEIIYLMNSNLFQKI